MDSHVQFRARQATVVRVRPNGGRSTGAPVIRPVAGLGMPIELSGGGPRSRHSPLGSGGVTPRPRCPRCKRIAEPKVRIRSAPAVSQANFRIAPLARADGEVGRYGRCSPTETLFNRNPRPIG